MMDEEELEDEEAFDINDDDEMLEGDDEEDPLSMGFHEVDDPFEPEQDF